MNEKLLEQRAEEYAKPLDIMYGGSFVRTTNDNFSRMG